MTSFVRGMVLIFIILRLVLGYCRSSLLLRAHYVTLFYLQIKESAVRVLSLPVNVPVMKVLSGLEYILKKAQVLITCDVVCVYTSIPVRTGRHTPALKSL